MDDTEKNLMRMWYLNMVSHYQYANYTTFPFECNMDNNKELKDRERIAKQIAKTSKLIRKKYRALKTGKIEEDIALEKYFKPIVEPLKQSRTPLMMNFNQLRKKSTL